MDQRIKKLMTMHKAIHPRDDMDRLYMSRKVQRRRLARIENSVDALIQGVEEYIKKSKERLFIKTRNSTDSIIINRTTRKPKWEEKQLYGYSKRQTSEISHEKT